MQNKSRIAFFPVIPTLLTLLITPSYGATNKTIQKGESSYIESTGDPAYREYVDKNTTVQVIKNTTFAINNIYNENTKKFDEILISTTIKKAYFPEMDTTLSSLEATAFTGDKKQTKLWTIKDRADTGYIVEDYYVTTGNDFCCSYESFYKLFDLKNGKHLLSYTVEPAHAIIANKGERIFSYISASTFYYDEHYNYKNGVGVLTINSDDSVVDRILIENNNKEFAWSPDKIFLSDKNNPIGTKNLTVFEPSVKGFSVKLSFYNGSTVISIPVLNDEFDIKNASAPKGFKFRRISEGVQKDAQID